MRKEYPPILDVTCGGRMMWFDHNNPLCLYVDNRELPPTDLGEGRLFEVKPDMLADFDRRFAEEERQLNFDFK